MLFVLDNYYSVNHTDDCLVVESDKSIEEVCEICAIVGLRIEEALVTTSPKLPIILEVLKDVFGMKDRKGDVPYHLLSRLVPKNHRMFDDISRFYVNEGFILDIRGAEADELPDFMIDIDGTKKNYQAPEVYDALMDKWFSDKDSILKLDFIMGKFSA